MKNNNTKLLALKKQVAELERVIGQKQIFLILDKMIELAEEHYKLDIKKIFYLTLEYFWKTRERNWFTLSNLYQVTGCSKQSFHQWKERHMQQIAIIEIIYLVTR